jgi:phytoene dehydrogenase-like protein
LVHQVVHIDFVALSDKATPEALAALMAAAAGLTALAEVVTAGVIEAEPGSDFDLAFFFVLRDFAALEPFGTNVAYVRFLQGFVAPVLRAFTGADVRLEDEMPPIRPQAACLALAAADETYDWEVKAALGQWTEALTNADSVVGLAVGERQRYRGLALAFSDQALQASEAIEARFSATFVAGKARSFGLR